MPLAVAITVTVTDAEGRSATTKVRVPTGYSLAQYTEFAQGLGNAIGATCSGQITHIGAAFGLDLTGLSLKVVAAIASDVYQKAQFIFNSAVNGFRKLFRLPALNESKVASASSSLNLADPDVAAVVSAFEDGVLTTEGTMPILDARGNDLTGLSKATEKFRSK